MREEEEEEAGLRVRGVGVVGVDRGWSGLPEVEEVEVEVDRLVMEVEEAEEVEELLPTLETVVAVVLEGASACLLHCQRFLKTEKIT